MELSCICQASVGLPTTPWPLVYLLQHHLCGCVGFHPVMSQGFEGPAILRRVNRRCHKLIYGEIDLHFATPVSTSLCASVSNAAPSVGVNTTDNIRRQHARRGWKTQRHHHHVSWEL
jgi:hypothetical protein